LIAPYFHFRDEITIQGNLMFRGERLIIPTALRRHILQQLHSSHLGINACLARAKDCVFWPNINSQLKDLISTCEACGQLEVNQHREPIVQPKPITRPFERVGAYLFFLSKQTIPGACGLFFGLLRDRSLTGDVF